MNATECKRYGKSVREARLAKGWSQRVLAEKCGITQPAICSVETGRAGAGPHLIKAIRKALKVSP